MQSINQSNQKQGKIYYSQPPRGDKVPQLAAGTRISVLLQFYSCADFFKFGLGFGGIVFGQAVFHHGRGALN